MKKEKKPGDTFTAGWWWDNVVEPGAIGLIAGLVALIFIQIGLK